MLNPEDIKEELSYAYVVAVAARAGYSVVRPPKDRDSVDAIVEAGGHVAADSLVGSPKIELQLKATTIARLAKDEFSFQLKVKNYRDLQRRNMCPRLLVVLVLPKNKGEWLQTDENQLVTRRCAYWTCLEGAPPTTNVKTRAVKLQRSNCFTVSALTELMCRASRFESLTG